MSGIRTRPCHIICPVPITAMEGGTVNNSHAALHTLLSSGTIDANVMTALIQQPAPGNDTAPEGEGMQKGAGNGARQRCAFAQDEVMDMRAREARQDDFCDDDNFQVCTHFPNKYGHDNVDLERKL